MKELECSQHFPIISLWDFSRAAYSAVLCRIWPNFDPKGNDHSPEIKQVFLNSSQVSVRFFESVKGSQLCSPWLDQILTSVKGCNSVANLKKMTLYNPNVDLVKDNVYTKFGLILSINS